MAKEKKGPEGVPAASGIPRHIAIIMDGNGRWAQRQGLPRSAGAETLRRVADHCRELDVRYLTVYAFSTENWKRPADEVGALMKLLERNLIIELQKMERDGFQMRFFGDTGVLSPRLQELIAASHQLSDRIDGYQINVCLNYGGRDEIVRAARRWADTVRNGEENNLDEETFSGLLWTAGVPDPELLIRSGGETRLSNFLLWQCAYSEFYFTDTLWPDFTDETIDRAIVYYRSRDRRFGGLSAAGGGQSR